FKQVAQCPRLHRARCVTVGLNVHTSAASVIRWTHDLYLSTVTADGSVKREQIENPIAGSVLFEMPEVSRIGFKRNDRQERVAFGEVQAHNPDVRPDVNHGIARLKLDLAQPVLIPTHLVFDYLGRHRLRAVGYHQVNTVNPDWLEAGRRLDAALHVRFDRLKQ